MKTVQTGGTHRQARRIAEIKADKSLHPEMVEKLEGAVAEPSRPAHDSSGSTRSRTGFSTPSASGSVMASGFLLSLAVIVVSIVADRLHGAGKHQPGSRVEFRRTPGDTCGP